MELVLEGESAVLERRLLEELKKIVLARLARLEPVELSGARGRESSVRASVSERGEREARRGFLVNLDVALRGREVDASGTAIGSAPSTSSIHRRSRRSTRFH
jgi:hypothetical protein